MKVLVIGSGGREHAMCWALSHSPLLSKLYIAPGNGGMHDLGECVEIAVHDHQTVIAFCRLMSIDLIVIGPEAPLVAGLADDLEAAGFLVVGPSAAAAQLEGSKAFTKQLCDHYNLPTARYKRFNTSKHAIDYVKTQAMPLVIKADGLAAGKGVIIAQTQKEAINAIQDILDTKVFGDAGNSLVIEEFLEGEEISFFALCDGKTALPFGSAQDHKRVGDGDTGPNTGGMGTYSPAPVMNDALHEKIMQHIISPALKGMEQDGHIFKGFLFAGLMINDNEPKLIEFNVRMGDPETQVILSRLKTDFLQLLLATAEGSLDKQTIEFHPHAAVCVVMAAKGYPGTYQKGSVINNLEAATTLPHVQIFHAGTSLKNGNMIATGGRVLGVTATGASVLDAQQQAYKAVDLIQWPEGFCRKDIAWRAINRLRS
ncbi:MAG: phosphoribosylamine--glycine ligase [Alphaproteobacteria bacterium]|nr:phosphoribosylamine--glycine ligase [Alphaproteobacteria bacterium]